MVLQVALRNKAKESATILDDSVFEGFNDSIQTFNPRLREVFGKFAPSDMQLTGSSPYMLVQLANSGLLPSDAKLATREELETAISRTNDFLQRNYADFGLALRTAGDSYAPNDLPAKVLAEQLEHRGIKLGQGKLIPLSVLSLKEENSDYGAVFVLNEKANKDNILDLNKFKWNWKVDDGLASAFLDRNWCWYSSRRVLAFSYSHGRVVVVSGEATAQKILRNYSSRFVKERDKTTVQVQKLYQEREAQLRAE